MPELNEAQRFWFEMRREAIHRHVSAFDVLRGNGIDIQQNSDETEEQISCPFHGADKKPSARLYPDENDSVSHVWCFVCQQPGWDSIGLYRMFNGGKENCTFGEALSGLERAYNLDPPPMPTGATYNPVDKKPSKDEQLLESFKELYLSCERRLLSCRHVYRILDDMYGYLAAGAILDKVKSRVGRKLWIPERGETALRSLLDKIQEKVNSCPEG